MVNVSSAMGAQFAEAVTRVTERIRGLGLNPLRADDGRRANKQRRDTKAVTTEPNGG